jgi:hypothetical protein
MHVNWQSGSLCPIAVMERERIINTNSLVTCVIIHHTDGSVFVEAGTLTAAHSVVLLAFEGSGNLESSLNVTLV